MISVSHYFVQTTTGSSYCLQQFAVLPAWEKTAALQCRVKGGVGKVGGEGDNYHPQLTL